MKKKAGTDVPAFFFRHICNFSGIALSNEERAVCYGLTAGIHPSGTGTEGMAMLWVAWLLIELYSGMEYDRTTFFITGAGVLCGAVLGGFIGMNLNRHVIRKADEVLEEIHRLETGA